MIPLPCSPCLIEGAFVSVGPRNPCAEAMVFQYNSDTIYSERMEN